MYGKPVKKEIIVVAVILESDPPVSLSIEHDFIWLTLGEAGKQGKSRIKLLGPAEARLFA